VYLVQSSINQAQQRRAELERRYELLNVANRRVAESVERKLEAAIVEVERLEGEVRAARVDRRKLQRGFSSGRLT
jgi:hypothetical protein